MRLVQIAQSYLIFLSLTSLSICRVLVAGNEDAFRSLARSYVPKVLAEKLVKLVSQAQAADTPNVEEQEAEEEYTNQGQVDQGQVDQGQVDQGQVDQGQVDQVQVDQVQENQGRVGQAQVYQGQVDQGQIEQAGPEQVDQAQRQQEEQASADENREYENPENHEQEYQADDGVQYEEDGQVNLRVNTGNDLNLPRQMRVNLDELVEKVRERLLDELATTTSASANIPVNLEPQQPQPKLHPLREQEYEQKITYSLPTNEPKHLYKTKGKAGVVIETGDLYDKVKLTKSNKKKDSYEDYAKKLPRKDYDVFETEEDNKPKVDKQEGRPLNKFKLKKQANKSNSKSKSTNLPIRNINNEETNNNINKGPLGKNNKVNSVKKIIPKRTRPTPENYDRNKTPYDSPDLNIPKIDPQTTSKHSITTTPVEYVDDDLTAGSSTSDTLQKAATEYIGGIDYYKDDIKGPGKKTTTEEPVQYPKKRKQVHKKIVTNMQIRLRYTLATPDFYKKLPRVAEKYNFEEPLPEKDREKEVLKQIGPPPAIINGNVKVKK